jgi:predicted  nucleic acid-binding Zn-ribbon protein
LFIRFLLIYASFGLKMDPLLQSLLIFLFLLPVVVLTIALVLYLLVLYWERKTTKDLNTARSKQRHLHSRMLSIRDNMGNYSPDDPEPFGSMAADIIKRLSEVDDSLRLLYDRYLHLKETSRELHWRDPRSILNMPFTWFTIQKGATTLLSDQQSVEERLSEIGILLNKLESQGLDVAQLTRQIYEEDQSALKVLTRLKSAEIQDPKLDSTYQTARDWENKLAAQVPVYFMSVDEATIKEKADKTTISKVYRIIDEARPEINTIVKDAHDWERQYEALEKALVTLTDSYRSLNAKVSELESLETYPIDWDQTRSKLSKWRQQIEVIGTIKKRRTLENLTRELEEANHLDPQLQDHLEHCRRLETKRKEIENLLTNPDIQQGEEWLRRIQKFTGDVKKYDPENWSRSEGAGRLEEDLHALVERQERLQIKHAQTPLQESEVDFLLEDLRQLESLHKALRPRVASIQIRYKDIQESERNAKDLIGRSRSLLNQSAALIGSNNYLSGFAASEVEQMQEDLEELADALEQPGAGTVEKKAQRANALFRKIEQASNRWLEKLEDGLDIKKKVLAEKLDLVSVIAPLDEPAMAEAERLLARDPQPASGKKSSLLTGLPFSEKISSEVKRRQREQLSLADAVAELKHKNDEWQKSISVTRAVEDIERPLLERYHAAELHAEETREKLQLAMNVISEDRAWPPTTMRLNTEVRQYEELEKRWENLKLEPCRAIQLISKISDLSEAYQELTNRINQILEKAQDEQRKALDYERRLGESMRMWQYQMQSYANNIAARDEIQNLLADAEAEAEEIRQKYLRGSIPFIHVLQSFRLLCQKVEGAQIPLEGDQMIDINGVIQRRFQ